MASTPTDLDALVAQKYQHGFVTDVESDTLAPGLDEDVVRVISKIKREPQFMLDWRLQALRHLPVSPSTPYSTASRSRRRSRTSCPGRA